MQPPYDIQERTFVFAVQVVNFCRELIAAHPVTKLASAFRLPPSAFRIPH